MWINPHTSKYPLDAPNELITQFKINALKEALNELVLQVSVKTGLKDPLEHQEAALVHLIHVQEGTNPTLFGL